MFTFIGWYIRNTNFLEIMINTAVKMMNEIINTFGVDFVVTGMIVSGIIGGIIGLYVALKEDKVKNNLVD